jgi:tetratricopeptide (TPR) repeat protein
LVVPILLALTTTAFAPWAWRGRRIASLWSQALDAAKGGDWEQAERALAGMAWYGALDAEQQRLRILAANSRGDLAAAAGLLGQVQGSPNEVVAARMEQGRILFDLGQVREAEAAYRHVLALQSSSIAARRALIAILGVLRRGSEQELELWALHDQAPSRIDARVEALCLLARGVPVIPTGFLARGVDEGMILRRGFQAEPDNSQLRAALAYFLKNRGELTLARQLLEPWCREHGDEPLAGDEYLALLLDLGRLDEARRWLNPPKRSFATAPTARRNMLQGTWLTMEGKPADAIVHFLASIEDDLRNPEPRHRLAQALRAAGRGKEAVRFHDWVEDARLLSQVASGIDYASPTPAAAARAADLCRRMGRNREAAAWMSLAQTVAPAAVDPASRFPRQ